MFSRGKKGMNPIHQRKKQDKTAIIIESGRGLGKETAIQLAECSRTNSEIDSVIKRD